MGKDDFSVLENMTYSGRGIITGMTPEGNSFMGYSLTGRSPPSQARRLVYDEKSGVIRTEVTDKEQLEKGSPALLLYPAIVREKDSLIASNGAQTKLIFTRIQMDSNTTRDTLDSAFYSPCFEYDKKDQKWIDITTYEPDAPNSTPRISALLRERLAGSKDAAAMHIVRSNGGVRESHTFPVTLLEGQGRVITTYSGGNENPLLPFEGRPLEVGVGSNTPENIVDSIYAAIQGGANPGDNYCVSAAVMMLKDGRTQVAIRNRSEIGS
jgi:IMP cyclohydrolase